MANVKLGSKAVGSIVKLKVNGSAKEFIVVHQGKPSSLYDDSCNGTWLLMKDIYFNTQWHTIDSNKYENSNIHSYLNGKFYNLFESNIRDVIKQVKIPYRKGGGSGGSDQSGANGLSAKIFLLSGYEVGWTTSDIRYLPVDGAKLDYFESGDGTSASNKRIATHNGVAVRWWLRSPQLNNLYSVIQVDSDGQSYSSNASNSYGIRPALVLPSDALVDDSGNVTPPVDLTAHKTLINGTAYTVQGGRCLVNGTGYTVQGGRCLVNGTGYDIKKGRTLIGGTGYDIVFKPSYDPVFANNTWEQIIAACHNNDVPETWKVADQKPMNINGVDYPIDIIGRNHDDYSDGSGKAPLTFQLHDCYGTNYAMNTSNTNVGGWGSSDMRITHLPAILGLMPAEVQSGIREVNKLTSVGNQSATISTKADKLFLLSEIEIFGLIKYSKGGEGTQYDYYKAGNSKTKKRNGNTSTWNERSPRGNNSEYFCIVNGYGGIDSTYASFRLGVAFAFCF